MDGSTTNAAMPQVGDLTPGRVAEMLRHSDEWYDVRRDGIGGSEAAIIAEGDLDKMEDLRLVKAGWKEAENVDYIFPIHFGTWTEAFNRFWFDKTYLRVSMENVEGVVHPDYDWMRANLDGRVGDSGLLECKTINAFTKASPAQKYYPQVQHNMAVTGTEVAYLSVIYGNTPPKVWEIARDEAYIEALIAAEWRFVEYLRADTPIVERIGNLEAPKEEKTVPTKTVAMTGNNEWPGLAESFIKNQQPARDFEAAKKRLKELMPKDAGTAHGHGVEIVRSASNALTVRPIKAKK